MFAVYLCAVALAESLRCSSCSEETVDTSATTPGGSSALPTEQPSPQAVNAPPNLIAVPDAERWLLSIAAPLAGRLRHANEVPIVIAVSATPAKETVGLVKRLSPRRALLLAPSPAPTLSADIENLTTDLVSTGSQPTRAGLLVAVRFWRTSKDVVIASLDDPNAVILGSALASHLAVPFIPACDIGDGVALSAALADLGVERVLLATVDAAEGPSWAGALGRKTEIVDAQAIYRLLVQRIGTQNVRNVILARAPREQPPAGLTSWLAPYLSVLRGAPVVLCDSPDGKDAEEKTAAVLSAYALKPRSVTILADYESIGVITVRDEAVLGEYEVEIEPCSGPDKGGAAPLGVGRIASASLEEASVLIARGAARERLLGKTPAHVLVIANPKTIYTELPLCETISRATAEEFKNLGLKVDEFYGKESSDPAIAQSAARADFILFEGHINDQLLFPDPYLASDTQDGYSPKWREDWPQSPTVDPPAEDLGDPTDDAPEPRSFSPEPEIAGQEIANIYQDVSGLKVSEPEELPSVPQVIKEGPQLDRLPLLVFQSCHSLEDWLGRQVFRSGAVAVVGSATNVYSASGSAFTKAFCDGLLYRGDTVGEALRDARNYFLCLAKLKAKRGHKEHPKVYRAGLSFRLWGDPEVRIPRYSSKAPKLRPVSATFASDKVIISTPQRPLPKSRTPKYFVEMFPGSQLAGIVKRIKDNPARQLMPVYFFRFPTPEGFAVDAYSDIQSLGETSPQAAFLTDPFHRFLYVVYLPQEAKRRQQLVLKFDRARDNAGP